MYSLNRPSKLQRQIAAFISIGAFLLLWQFSIMFTNLGNSMAGPGTILIAFIKSCFVNPIGSYTMIGHMLWSIARVMIAFIAAAVLGIVIGILMGTSKTFKAIFSPIFEIIRPIPPIAWIPLVILWFGLGELSKYFLIFLAAFCNITPNAYHGVKSVDPVLIGAARMLGANKLQIFFTIILPSSVPYIFAGLHTGLSVSWRTSVAAEMIRSNEGVGWVITNAQSIYDTTQMLIGIVAIGIIGYLLSVIMRGVESRLCAWNKNN